VDPREQAQRIIDKHREPLDPVAWARIAVGLGWDEDESTATMAAHFDLPAGLCRGLFARSAGSRPAEP
jgi:hypothetical protein